MERKNFLHITSLESPHGIGTLGECAYRFADFLKRAGQSYWQILPLGVTGYGDSPYQPYSSFAGNPLLIDLDMLVEEGLLMPADLETLPPVRDAASVDYDAVRDSRRQLLLTAYRRSGTTVRRAVQAFAAEQADWLSDYSLYGAQGAVRRRVVAGLAEPVPAAARLWKTARGRRRPASTIFSICSSASCTRSKPRQRSRDPPDRRPAHLLVRRLRRCLGASGALPERRLHSRISGVPPTILTASCGQPAVQRPHKATKYEWWMKRTGAATLAMWFASIIFADSELRCARCGHRQRRDVAVWPGHELQRAIKAPSRRSCHRRISTLSGARSFRDSGYRA